MSSHEETVHSFVSRGGESSGVITRITMRLRTPWHLALAPLLGNCGGAPVGPAAPAPATATGAPSSGAVAPVALDDAGSTAAASERRPLAQESLDGGGSRVMAAGPDGADKRLAVERERWKADRDVELARWTPELHAKAKALAEKGYASLHEALAAVLPSPHRKPGNAARDKYRHPAETLAFFGVRPTSTVLEVGPGDGWYTELLAPTLAAHGRLVTTVTARGSAENDFATFAAERWGAFVGKSPELYGKVETIAVTPSALALDAAGKVDVALFMREVHGMVNDGTLAAWLAAVRSVLKPSGVLGIEEHRAKAGSDPGVSAKAGYVPQTWLVQTVEAAGFKLAGSSEINANAKDTKDYPAGVWALPPTLRNGALNRQRYLDIGESDRMTLKFVLAASAPVAAH